MKISIITPCLNAEAYIEETVRSVLEQRAVTTDRVELEYLVMDGASTDGTLEILEQFGSALTICSDPDRGLYDALGKGLQRVTGEVTAYLNAGDYYHKSALDIVVDIFEAGSVQWLTGYNAIYGDKSYLIDITLPLIYRKRLFECGMYGRILPFVQQESTFWLTKLHELINFPRLASFKYAGDYFLWHSFSRKCDLKIVKAYLGGFRLHPQQLSANKGAYDAEVRTFTRRPNPVDRALSRLDWVFWRVPYGLRKGCGYPPVIEYDPLRGRWQEVI